jgi:hypothetical protein
MAWLSRESSLAVTDASILRCNVCAAVFAFTDESIVVLAAEIATFTDAHSEHESYKLQLELRPNPDAHLGA